MQSQLEADVRQAWQQSPEVMLPLTTNLLQRASRRFSLRERSNNRNDVLSQAVVSLLFIAGMFLAQNPLSRMGSVLFGLGFVYNIAQVVRHYRRPMPAEGCLDFYRAQLTRRRDLCRSVLRWFIVPTSPGAIIGILGSWLSDPHAWTVPLRMAICWPGVCYLLWRMNNKEATKLQLEIDALPK